MIGPNIAETGWSTSESLPLQSSPHGKVLFVPALNVLAAHFAEAHRFCVGVEFQICDGVAGNGEAEANAVFVADVLTTDIALTAKAKGEEIAASSAALPSSTAVDTAVDDPTVAAAASSATSSFAPLDYAQFHISNGVAENAEAEANVLTFPAELITIIVDVKWLADLDTMREVVEVRRQTLSRRSARIPLSAPSSVSTSVPRCADAYSPTSFRALLLFHGRLHGVSPPFTVIVYHMASCLLQCPYPVSSTPSPSTRVVCPPPRHVVPPLLSVPVPALLPLPLLHAAYRLASASPSSPPPRPLHLPLPPHVSPHSVSVSVRPGLARLVSPPLTPRRTPASHDPPSHHRPLSPHIPFPFTYPHFLRLILLGPTSITSAALQVGKIATAAGTDTSSLEADFRLSSESCYCYPSFHFLGSTIASLAPPLRFHRRRDSARRTPDVGPSHSSTPHVPRSSLSARAPSLFPSIRVFSAHASSSALLRRPTLFCLSHLPTPVPVFLPPPASTTAIYGVRKCPRATSPRKRKLPAVQRLQVTVTLPGYPLPISSLRSLFIDGLALEGHIFENFAHSWIPRVRCGGWISAGIIQCLDVWQYYVGV
ncbi:hypothetical protein C8R44DRAFT_877468 [Mycena epipterygia]|nr:hypothetical protein C8R44DRAFT_877468 [Mycena epipterygia]